ncbi:MAG: hypothetical protein COC01_01685 [Bacteroidetes bacterium]|nr:MAG: hypothetical protein COC01_01685 [Bacteroidota bacterium]
MRKFIFLFLSTFSIVLFAQSPNIPLGNNVYDAVLRVQTKNYFQNNHSTSLPVNNNVVYALLDSLGNDTSQLSKTDRYLFSKTQNRSSKKPILKHFYKYKKDFYAISKKEFELYVNPVLYLTRGTEKTISGTNVTYINTRGLEVKGLIGKKIGFYSFLAENQMQLPSYVSDKVNMEYGLPGEGYYKWFKDKYRSYDFFTAYGYFTFNATKHVNIQFGHGKNFIGDGYRSLVLSDYSNNYLFLKSNTKVWKLNYQTLLAELVSDHIPPSLLAGDVLLDKKYLAIHHLSYNLTKNINFGVFESVVFGRNDTTKAQHFELNYLNPLIFYRSIEQAIGSPDNVIMGTNLKINFLKTASVYTQFVLDDFNFSEFKNNRGYWGNKFGLQLGAKYFDIAGIDNLDALLEYNRVRPYTYTHVNDDANHTHYNQPLAHPLGANFKEIIAGIKYNPFPKLTASSKVFIITQGLDMDSTNYGANIYLSNNDPTIPANNTSFLQGLKTDILLMDMTLTYEWKPNIYLDLKVIRRVYENALQPTETSNHIYLGFRMNVSERKFEF